MFQPLISWIYILYIFLYIVFICFNRLGFLIFGFSRIIESMFISEINPQFYFIMFLLLILLSKLYSVCKMS